ncbi:MAG TPA: amino acid permease [Mycobacteriales bacterium]|nr:amino acid permease [Mycobacteriales bacterium]
MAISTTRGIALYVGALLGPGLLVLPGLAAAAAGPASILAWIGLLVLSGLVAVVFARFGVAHPSGAGVAEYARLGLGAWAGRAVGWCFLAGIIAGAPMICYLGAGYLASLLGAGRGLTAVAGGAILAVVLAVTLRGIRASTTVQLVLMGVLVLVIVVAVVGAAPSSRAANWTPFAPHGWSAIGSAATVLMLSFVGWEAIAPLTDRFADPGRQLPRVIGAAFAITIVIYLALAAVTVAALGTGAGTAVPMAELLSRASGGSGDAVAAATAVLLTIVTVNAYLTGGATLARTLTARPGPDFPRWFLAAIVGSGAVGSVLLGSGAVSVAAGLGVPSACFLIVYLGCMASAYRVLSGAARVAAVAAAVAIVVVLRYAGWAALLPALVVVASVVRRPRRPRRVAPECRAVAVSPG